MGFSISGLSLVPPAAAELGADDVAQHGVAAGHQASKHLLSTDQAAWTEEDGSTDSEVGWPMQAVCACADGRPSQPKDVASQSTLFSSLWTSALETSEPESSPAGHNSLSIPTSAELMSARGAYHECPPDVFADGDAVAAAAGDFLGAGSQADIGESPAAASKAVAAAAESAATDTAVAPDAMGAEGDNGSEALADHQSLGPSETGGSRELPNGSRASRTESPVLPDEEPTGPTRNVPANDLANPFATSTTVANNAASNTTAPGGSARPAAPHADTVPALPQGVSAMGDADASAAQATRATPQSEIAFQAEIQLNNSQDDAPVSNSQRGTLTRWVASPREDSSANSGSTGERQTESKTAAENAETVGTSSFRRADSDTGASSLGQDHAGGNLDRGTQQTTPLSHGPFVMNSRPSSEGALSSRVPAAPAAAQLDAAAPDAPPETGQAARSVALKIQSEEHGAANVVLTDRGGQVHVTVRSGDPALTNALRGDLGSLAGGLQQHGFDVKFWNRSSNLTMDADASGNSDEFSGQDDVRGQARHRHSPDDTGHHARRGEWIEEFD